MTDPDPNVNVYRAQWAPFARVEAGYPEEKRKEAIERLSHSTTEAGIKEYLRLTGKQGRLK